MQQICILLEISLRFIEIIRETDENDLKPIIVKNNITYSYIKVFFILLIN